MTCPDGQVCDRAQINPVRLQSGAVVCSSCQAWREDCEVRFILAMEPLERQGWLNEIERRRGAPAVASLRAKVEASLLAAEHQGIDGAARAVMALPTRPMRAAQLDTIARRHGRAYADRVGEAVKALWATRATA